MVKQPGSVADDSPPSSAKVQKTLFTFYGHDEECRMFSRKKTLVLMNLIQDVL
jgi:hypothetical protein